MIQYDETRLAMEALTPQIEELKGALNLEGLKIKVDELEMKSTEPNFWDDPEKAQAVQQQIGQYKNTIDSFNRRKTNHDDVLAMIELAEEENDESAVDEVKELAEKVKSEFEEQKLATLLTGEYDSDTQAAVRRAQQIFQLPQTGLTDRATWQALAGLHNALFRRTPLGWSMKE